MRYIFLRLIQFASIVLLLVALMRYWAIRPISCLPNCAGAAIANRSLSNYNLRGANLVEADLSGSNLSNADLSNADLSGANLSNTALNNANLTGTILVGANLTGADLRNSTLDNTNFKGANLSRVNLTRANLTNIALQGAVLEQAILIESRISDVDLSGVNLRRTDLTSAMLDRIRLEGAFLSGAELSGASLVEARLNGAFMNVANLTGANLTGANLSGAALIGSNLSSANLRDSELIGAITVGTNFNGADLSGADITGASLFQYELESRNLSIDPVLTALNELQLSKVVVDANLKGVEYTADTRWPDGKLALLSQTLGSKFDTIYAMEVTKKAAETATVNPTTTTDQPTPDENQLPPVNPAEVTGNITVVGGTTVGLITEVVAKQFATQGYSDTITFEATPIDQAFARFCRNESPDPNSVANIDIIGTSRAISDAERAVCATIDRKPIRFSIGSDAVAVVVNPSNRFANDVTIEQLKAIFTAKRWNDVNPAWPAEPITRYLPVANSDAATLFTQALLGEAAPTDSSKASDFLYNASNVIVTDSDEKIVQGIASSSFAVGFVNFKTFQQNSEILQILMVNGVKLNPETIENGKYILSRPLLLYTDADILQKRPQVASLLNFYLRNVGGILESLNYFQSSQALINDSLNSLKEASAIVTAEPVTNTPVARNPRLDRSFNLPDPLTPGSQSIPITDLQGNITIAGSAYAISPTVIISDEFKRLGFTGAITLNTISDDQVFELFCETAQVDLVVTNHLIDTDKADECADINRIPMAFPVGIDVLAVVVNPENTFVRNVTKKELAQLFTAENWSDVNPAWPNEPIQRFVPPTTSSVFNLFVNQILDSEPDRLIQAPNIVSAATRSGQVRGIATNPYAIGFFEYSAYRQNADAVGLVAIDGIEPTISRIENGTYPLTQSLLLYSAPSILQEKPQLAAWLNFYLTNANLAMDASLYVPARQQDLAEARNQLNQIFPIPTPTEEPE